MEQNTDSLKMLVVGLDGVPFEYLDPLLVTGQLPHLAKLIEHGLRAPLRSVYPPMTPAAWPSFATGKNPGKHGVFGWWELVKEAGKPAILPADADSVHGLALWDLLSRSNLRVGVMNVPLTFPAHPVNGFLISGFDNPFEDIPTGANLTYPPRLLNQLQAVGISYKVLEVTESDLPMEPSLLVAALERWIAAEITRTESAIWLRKHYSPHFMMIVYHIADYFMHRAPRDSVLVIRSLQALDSCLGMLLEQCDDDTTVIVLSDHGSIELKKYIYLQNWLVDRGLLQFRDVIPLDNLAVILKAVLFSQLKDSSRSAIRSLSDQTMALWETLPERLQRDITAQIRSQLPACCMSDSNIDWTRTRAFTLSAYGEVTINVRGRQPQGIVEPGREYEELVAYLLAALKELTRFGNRRIGAI